MKNILALIVTVTLGIILAGSMLMPAISDAQYSTSDEITKVNDTAVLLRPAQDGDVLKAEFIDNEWVWSLNDVEIQGIGDNSIYWNTYLISDAAYVSGRGSTGWAASLTVFDTNPTSFVGFGNAQYADYITATFTGDTITFAGAIASPLVGPVTTDYTWAYVVCPEEEATYCAAVSGGTAYIKSPDDVILCGVYTTGENDCSYIYKNGEATVIGGEYTIKINETIELVEGTYDIYTDTVSVDIGDENFTPFRIFVPYEINGHATSGAAYSLIGAIPILVIVMLLIGAVGAILIKGRD